MITLNKKSWHGRLAFHYPPWSVQEDDVTDICSYIRAVLRGVLLAVILTGIISFFAASLMTSVISLYTGLGILPYELWFQGGLCVLIGLGSFVGIAALIAIFSEKVQKWKRDRRHGQLYGISKQPGFIRTAYDSVKEKTCILIQFND